MEIIPAINCPDFECVKNKLQKAAEISRWVQLDIADGKFTPHKTWNNPEELSLLITQYSLLNLEVHLMVENPESVIENWIGAGAKRIIAHLEAIKNLKLITNNLKTCELGLAIAPDTSVEDVVPLLSDIKFVQVLAVYPGKVAQKFDKRIPAKIKFLKKNYPDVIIEVDGGINLETAKLCKEAGADILVTATYIWESADPQSMYRKLVNI